MQEILRDVPRRLEGTGIAVGTSLGGRPDAQEKIDWGYRFIIISSSIGSVLRWGVEGLRERLNSLRG